MFSILPHTSTNVVFMFPCLSSPKLKFCTKHCSGLYSFVNANVFFIPFLLPTVLLQCGADAAIRNSDGKTALDLAEPTAKLVLSGDYKKEELLEAARTGNEELLMAFITPLNVNCHADDGRKVWLHGLVTCTCRLLKW